MCSESFGLRRFRDAAVASVGTLRPAPAGAHAALKIVLDSKVENDESTEQLAKIDKTIIHATIESSSDAAKHL